MAIRKLDPSPAAPAASARPSVWLGLRLVLIGCFMTLATARFLVAPLDRFDEGVTLTKGAMAAAGRVPYRDFWNSYGALDLYILAAAFRLMAVNVTVARVLGAVVMLLIAATTYALMRDLGLRDPIRFLMTGLITVAPLSLATFNSPFLAVLLGLGALLTFMIGLERRSLRWPAACGCLIGVTAFCRPEFAVALGAGLTIGYLVVALHPGSRTPRPALVYIACGLAAAAVLWGPMVLLAGFNPVWFDIVVHALTLYARGRSIPIGQGHEGPAVVILSAAFALIWFFGILRAYRQRGNARELARVTALVVGGGLAFAWVVTRADGIHAMAAWPVTGVLLALLLERRARRQPAAPPRFEASATLAGILLCCVAAGGLTVRDLALPHAAAGIPRAGLAGERAWMPMPQLATLIQQIDASVPPDQPIWVGRQRNDLVVFDDNTIYFLSGREPGTVFDEAFPGLTNTEATERTMACQLARSGVTLVVLGPDGAPEPWNLSAVAGSTYLDRWIAGRTIRRTVVGPYELVRLRPGLEPADRCP